MGMSQNEPVVPAATPANTNAANRAWWSMVMARYITNRRNSLGLTVTQAAALSGLQLSEWLGLEEGWVPQDQGTICAIAATLRISWTQLDTLALIVRLAQESR